MRQIYKFLYTIIQITKKVLVQVSRLIRQLNEIFRAIVLTERKKECDSCEPQKDGRNIHGFPSNLGK
jgi:hypothetical protein